MAFYTCVNRFSNNILYRGYDDSGKRLTRKIKFQPTLYFPTKKNTGWTAFIDNIKVEPKQFFSMSDAKAEIERFKDVSNHKIYGNTNYIAQYIWENFPGKIEFDIKQINITSIDIEVHSEQGFPKPEEALYPVNAITIHSTVDNVYYSWGLAPFDTDKRELKEETVVYTQCKDERDLLLRFIEHWRQEDNTPDVVTGWNSRLFDIPYLVNRINRLFGESFVKKLSPFEVVNYKKVSVKEKTLDAYDIYGIQQLDYLDLFQKFSTYGAQESYRLNFIANLVLGQKKLSYEEFEGLADLANRDHQKFMSYNIQDVLLIVKMEDKLGLIELAMSIAYRGGVNYNDAFGTTHLWETLLYRELSNRYQALPPTVYSARSSFPGGYVKEPIVGLHKWICSYDLNSLYPSILIQWNMSPETLLPESVQGVDPESLLGGLKLPQEPNVSIAGNGARFRTDIRGLIPEIVSNIYTNRKAAKKKMLAAKQKLEQIDKTDKALYYQVERDIAHYGNEQQALKILLNSVYGAMGSPFFKFFRLQIAEAVTLSGQFVIKTSEKILNNYFQKLMNDEKDRVVAMDTDSCYVSMEDIVAKYNPKDSVNFLDKMSEEVVLPLFVKGYDKIFNDMNCLEKRLVMGREVIGDTGIFIARKRYLINVLNSEGVQYTEPKIKMMGVEAIKYSTPEICRDALKEIFKVIMKGEEEQTREAINTFKRYFLSQSPENISFPRGINDLTKWKDHVKIYIKGTPIHVRGALLHNHHLKKKKTKIKPIQEGDKVKFCYLKMPNPIRENIITFVDYLPKELGLEDYVDYETQFEKTFINPIKSTFTAVGWNFEEQGSLDDFFN